VTFENGFKRSACCNAFGSLLAKLKGKAVAPRSGTSDEFGIPNDGEPAKPSSAEPVKPPEKPKETPTEPVKEFTEIAPDSARGRRSHHKETHQEGMPKPL
jgi:hypothetical protein